MNKKVIIIGAGGHAKVIADIVIKSGDKLFGYIDDKVPKGTNVLGYEVIGKIEDAEKVRNDDIYFAIGIGDNKIRKEIYIKYKVNYYTAVHPTAVIAMDVTIDEGTTIAANSVIGVSSKIGKCCIINTGSIIEHDNIIEDFVHIKAGTIVESKTTIQADSYIETGSVIKRMK